jgi:RNA polymerase sigma-70 factor (ECF subfamily)
VSSSPPFDPLVADAHAADLVLVQRALAGDDRAVDALIERLSCLPAMLRERNRRYGARLSSSDLAEVEQETLAALWIKLRAFEGRASIETWAFRFATNEVLKALDRRERTRREVRADPDLLDRAPSGTAEELPIDHDVLRACVANLDAQFGTVIAQRHFQELSFDEIARRQGAATSAIKARYYRGLGRLRELLLTRLRSVRP